MRIRFRDCTLAAGVAAGLACSTTAPELRGRALTVSGDYLHPATQVRFPDRIDDLERARVIALDGDEAGVGVVYTARHGAELTLSLYPAGDPIAGRLRNEFLRARAALQQSALVSMIDRTRVVRAPRPDGSAVGFESELRRMVAASGATDLDLLQVFQCGRFFLKLHATHAEGALGVTPSTLDRVHAQVPCQDVARLRPGGAQLRVGLDPEILPGGSEAEWIAHGFAQLEWIEGHVAKQDLVFGIPDHEPALYLSAWRKTLSLRDQLAQDGKAPPNPFLDRLLRIERAGYLEEYVWTEYLGFLDPPAKLEPRLARFQRWRDAKLPGLEHEVRAAAQLAEAP